jgi:CDP-2,3-bis-(O-geranylgeranyl)-sn-glycerol synthase
MYEVLFAFWFMLPAAGANMAPVLVAKIPGSQKFNWPLDGHKTLGNKPIFGPHKTWIGLLSGIIVSVAVFAAQQNAFAQWEWLHTISNGVDYALLPSIWVGILFGLGALGGDAVESFFKRRVGIPSGHAWVPWDQLDYVIGAILATLPFVRLSVIHYFIILLMWFLFHLLASFVGFKLGLKERPI